MRFDDSPIAPRWRLILHEPAAVQTRFTQPAWSVP